jgi:hypothetical protein
VSHHWLRTVVSRPDRDPTVIEDGSDIVGVHPLEGEPEYAGLVRGCSYQLEAFDTDDALCRIAEQLLFPR